MTTLYNFVMGTLLDSMTNLELLAVPVTPPKSTYSPYSSVIELADGSKRGIGAPIATWHWGFLPRNMRDQLRVFCPGASSLIHIGTYTKDNAGELRLFQCEMIWPVTDEETETTRTVDFTIEFRQLIDKTGLGGLLGELALVSTGTVAISGVLAQTLGPLTLVSTGTVV